jgi:hypothetical protein
VHEWGTFTSLQDPHGTQVDWVPGWSPDLPSFVIQRSVLAPKVSTLARQRLETPVIYFHTTVPLTVTVTVRFPAGLVTELYPPASRLAAADSLLRPLPGGDEVSWDGLRLLPDEAGLARVSSLPGPDPEGPPSHYFAARAADAATVEAGGLAERFLFYRGVGHFDAPLHAITTSGGRLTLANRGDAALGPGALLEVEGSRGRWQAVAPLAPGQVDAVSPKGPWLDGDALVADLGRHLEGLLVTDGLFPDEAAAMVATWSASWLREPGLRVLYLLPHAWTDATLPLTITPRPERQQRVMVARAELVTPETLAEVRRLLAAAPGSADLSRFGRFARPLAAMAQQRTAPP